MPIALNEILVDTARGAALQGARLFAHPSNTPYLCSRLRTCSIRDDRHERVATRDCSGSRLAASGDAEPKFSARVPPPAVRESASGKAADGLEPRREKGKVQAAAHRSRNRQVPAATDLTKRIVAPTIRCAVAHESTAMKLRRQ